MRCFFLVYCLILIGCDNAENQDMFEDEAFADPSGFTRTNEYGEVVSEDVDDWRTSPAYLTRIDIAPAFPNPVPVGEFVSIPIKVRDFNAIRGGLDLVYFDENRIARRLDEIRNASNPGAYVFIFNPAVLGVGGLLRVFIVDSGGGLVSYGDLLVEQ